MFFGVLYSLMMLASRNRRSRRFTVSKKGPKFIMIRKTFLVIDEIPRISL